MIYWIIYLVGVLFSIALYIFVQWKAKRSICLGELITIIFCSAFSWIAFMVFAVVSDITIFDFENNDRKTKMRE